MPSFPHFIGGSAPAQSAIADAERAVNLYVEKTDVASALYPTPGFARWAPAVADVGGRALTVANGRLFGLMGAGFYEWDANGTATKWGTVAVDANPGQMVFNGVVGGQLGIASGGNAYCFALATNTLTPVLTGDCTMLAYAAGFGLAFNIATGHVRLSNLNDLTTWPADTFFQRSLFADPYQAMFVDANNLVWLIGTDTFEVRYNSGVGTQPFVPLSGLVGRYGIAAPFAFGLSGLGNFWLARNPEGIGQFVVTRGSVPTPVSPYPVNTAIAQIARTTSIDNAEVLVYQQEGHTFANIGFPASPATWTYDVEADGWAERGAWNPMLGRYDLWSPRVHALAFGKHLVGDRATGTLWQMDTATATEINGTGIRRLRRSPHLNQEHARIPLDRFELLMDVGLGLPSGQGSDPQALLRVSADGGRTWGNERMAGIGRLGEYRRRVVWNRLGAPADAVFEVTYSDPTPFRVIDAWLNAKEAA